MNFYKRHIGDYIKATAHLSLLEHGIYNRLLDVYYTRESGIPEEQAARLIGARSPAEKAALQSVLSEFFQLVDGEWRQSRCDEEIAAANEKAERNREVGKKGGRPRKMGSEKEPRNNPDGFCEEPKHNPSQTPVTSNQTPSSDSDPSDLPQSGSTIDQALFADARKICGRAIGGLVNKAIKSKGKPWVLQILETCRSKDPEAARAYFSAALNGAGSPTEAQQRRVVP